MKVAVIGATGRTGSLVVQLLLFHSVTVRALVRSKEKAASVLAAVATNPNLELILGQLEDIQSLKELVGDAASLNAVIIASGTLSPLGLASNSPHVVDYLGVRNLLSILSSTTHVVLVSTVGLNTWTRPITLLLEYFGGRVMKWKAEGERLVRGWPGLQQYTIIRPAILHMNIKHVLTQENIKTPIGSAPAVPVTSATLSSSGSAIDTSIASETLIVDQSDTIDGRVERIDLARVCVETVLRKRDLLPEKCTFELVASSRKVNSTCSEPTRDIHTLFRHLKPDALFEATTVSSVSTGLSEAARGGLPLVQTREAGPVAIGSTTTDQHSKYVQHNIYR